MEISKGLVLKSLGGLGAASAAALGLGLGGNPFSKSSESWDFKNLEEIDKSLNLPEKCKLQKEGGNALACGSLTADELKNINFEGKVEGSVSATNVNLEIVKNAEESFYPGGYKFIFKTSVDVTNPVSLKKNTNTEFKIKKREDGTWSLERAWDIHKLGEKIGLKDCTEGTTGKCSFADDKKINYYENDGSFTVQGTMTLDQEQKINFTEDQEKCNQGFCFKIEKDISVTQVTPAGITRSGPDVPPISKDHTYQIEERELKNNQKYWFLVVRAS